MRLSREQLYEEENRMNSGNGPGTGWDPFGWINKWGHAPGLEPSWVNDAIYAHYVADNINEMYASPYGGYWNPSMSSAYAFSSSNEALGFAVSNNPDITVTAYGGGALGSQDILYENASTGSAVVVKTPFWRITGSYYNELYYFSGLVAFDTYRAKRELVASGASVDFTFALGPIGFSIEAGSIDYNDRVHRFYSILNHHIISMGTMQISFLLA